VETDRQRDEETLAELEIEKRIISSRRRRLQRIDFIRGGGVNQHPESFDRLLEQERELSARRHELHLAIDELRERLGRPVGPWPEQRPRLEQD
jgi:hypothetical protein